jgi:hypothetical protein
MKKDRDEKKDEKRLDKSDLILVFRNEFFEGGKKRCTETNRGRCCG